jgi:methyltransferase-like protein/trans-aconitate methyltransferase
MRCDRHPKRWPVDKAHISYDQVPYPSLSYAQSSPDRLATLATLLGLDPAPVDHCRVLELGCASGGNLIPLAYKWPESGFVGIDASQRQIADGQATVATLELKNVTLKSMDILDITPDLGEFDYIIAHGVYSWVPPATRDQIFCICKQNLAPNGVAYVSYNTYPGWHMMDIIRDAMLYHTRELTDPEMRTAQSRAMLDFLAESVPAEKRAYGSFLKEYANFLRGELRGASSRGDAFLLHDELEGINDPVYFHQFAERAAEQGLQYLVEADFANVFPDNFSPDVKQALQKMAQDIIEMEQYMDFLRNRTFRQTLLCHNDITVQRTLVPERVSSLCVASRARPVADHPDINTVSVEQFRSPDGATLSTDHPVSKASLLYLAEIWPRAVSFEDLLSAAYSRLGKDAETDSISLDQDTTVLGANLLRAYSYSIQLVELHVHIPPLVSEVSECPVASPVARVQAQDSTTVTNLWHNRVHLDPLQRHLLCHLDGIHNRVALLNDLVRLEAEGVIRCEVGQQEGQPVRDSGTVRDILARGLEKHLYGLARSALLIG